MEHALGSVAGVVLAGGLSTRMGHDKAHLRPHGPDKPDLLARTHALLADLLPLCWVSCRADAPRSGYECLFDAKPGQGPAAGILAALRAAQAQAFALHPHAKAYTPRGSPYTWERLMLTAARKPVYSAQTQHRKRCFNPQAAA